MWRLRTSDAAPESGGAPLESGLIPHRAIGELGLQGCESATVLRRSIFDISFLHARNIPRLPLGIADFAVGDAVVRPRHRHYDRVIHKGRLDFARNILFALASQGVDVF